MTATTAARATPAAAQAPAAGPSPRHQGTLTLGVAVMVPEPYAQTLAQCRRRSGDAAAELIRPHVTLLPPTPVAGGALGQVLAHLRAAAAAAAPFEMHLAGTGTFRPASPVVFVQVARGVADCEALEAVIRRGPLHRELSFTYHPHVTVAQDVPDAALDACYEGLAQFTARFVVREFVLCLRDADDQWQAHSSFPLGQG